MTSDHEIKNEEEELVEGDSEASIDDSMLDEISEDVAVDEPEGFGHIKEEETAVEEEPEKAEGAELEEDAEDVDYDSFDDEDHL